jgi:CheY-like chemotaxis protein
VSVVEVLLGARLSFTRRCYHRARATLRETTCATRLVPQLVTRTGASSRCIVCPVGLVRRKVLLVDDSQLSLDVATRTLQDAGYDVRATAEVNGLSAMFGSWLPDVILTDVNMPNMSGPELCSALKSSYETAHVPVVLFSAISPDRLEVLARQCEADGFLSKGELHELPAALDHLIAHTLF